MAKQGTGKHMAMNRQIKQVNGHAVKQKAINIMALFIIWNVALSLGGALWTPYLMSSGYSVMQVLLFYLLFFLSPLPFLLLLRQFTLHLGMLTGILIRALCYLLFVFLGAALGGPVFAIISGISVALVWVPFNILWFERKTEKAATNSSIYFALMSLASIIVPFIAGLIAQRLGYDFMYAGATALLFISLPLIFILLKDRGFSFNVKDCISHIKGFRTLIIIEGFFGMMWCVIGLISYKFFPTPEAFGIFLSLTALISILLSLIFAGRSDASGSRRNYILLFIGALSLSVILSAFAPDYIWWFIFVIFINFFSTLLGPFPTTLLYEKTKDAAKAMYGREVFLTLGRVLGGIAGIILYFIRPDLRLLLIMYGLSTLAYAAVFEFSKREKLGIK